ncbi:MAG: ABC transporter ATP-binding protein [Elusimicrobiota bacterium]
MAPLLKIENLSVEYVRGRESVRAVRGVSWSLEEREAAALVGESGCGKSTLALAVLRLLPERAARIASGRILFQGKDLLAMPPEELRRVRGGDVGMVFQDPFSALNPVLTVGEQIEEVLELHAGGRNKTKALEALEKVSLPGAERIYGSYPHQMSGGQRQRAGIAMAIAAGPKLLIADEPTTALDVTVQKEILDLLDRLRQELGMAMLFITHNLGLAAERTTRLAVMYAGEIVEEGRTSDVLAEPKHPYTRGLLRCLPRIAGGRRRLPVLAGAPPDLRSVPSGCAFHPRCPDVFEPCADRRPEPRPVEGRPVACHLYEPAAAEGKKS